MLIFLSHMSFTGLPYFFTFSFTNGNNYSLIHLNTSVVTSHESKAFSTYVWSSGCGLMRIRAIQRHACKENTEKNFVFDVTIEIWVLECHLLPELTFVTCFRL